MAASRPRAALLRAKTGVKRAAALATALLLAGCGATKDDFTRLETSAQDQHAQMRQEVSSLRASLDQLSSALRQLRADLDNRLDEVNSRMGIVESLMRDNEQMFQRFQRRLQETQQQREELAPGDTAAAGARTGGEAALESPAAGGTPDRGAAGGAIPSEIDLYNGALNDYQAGRYDLALAAFREYLRLYPDGTSPDNAQFWIGKILLDQGSHDAATRELERLLATYPETDKAAPATFYLGNAYRALGNEPRARAYYRDVIERYPASQESQLARRELER